MVEKDPQGPENNLTREGKKMKELEQGLITFIGLVMLLGFACTWAPQPVIETSVKIAARHLAHRGMEKWPDQFRPLGMISKSACELGKGNDLAIQGAFSVLARLVLQDLKDPLLKADLEDLIGLMGASLTIDFKVQDISPEIQKILEVVVCEFAKGVK